MKRRVPFLSAALLAATVAAQAQMIPFDLEVGYRWLDVDGNDDMYRTHINEEDGFLIRHFTLATSDLEGHTTLFDRFRIDVSDLGVGPAGSVRIEAARNETYRLRLGYRSTEAFSALPAFANPLVGQAIIPGQHVYDRKRTMLDIDLELIPGRAITPFLGYTWNDTDAPGQTTYHLGQDEFRLRRNLRERDRELRAGAAFHFGPVHGVVTQGWRNFHAHDSLTLSAGANGGNNPGPVLGEPVTADSITRSDRTDVDTPFTTLYVTGQAMKRLRLVGNYTRFAADSDGSENEAASGSFVSFPLRRFFAGTTVETSSSAKNTTWRGGGRAEVNVHQNVDFSAGFQREHREIDGVALVDTLFIESITFSGFDQRDIQTILEASSSVDRDRDVVHAAISSRQLGPFALRAEYRQADEEVLVAPDLSEIVVPGGQGGSFDRVVKTVDLNGSFTQSGFSLGVAWRSDDADEAIFRTDFLDRERLRGRASWSSKGNFFRGGVTAERTTQSNDSPESGYDGRIRQYSADAEVAPLAWLRLRASISQFRADSDITIRRPENFSLERSEHEERGSAREGNVSFLRAPFSLDAGLSRFENRGSLPFEISRYRLRAGWDFKPQTGLALEWDRDNYDETSPSFGDYEASRYGLYFRWRPQS